MQTREIMANLLPTFVRHQAGSLIASALDFSTMIAGVRLFGLHPALATAVGAAAGATINFLLGRYWIFPRGIAMRDRGGASALRYALVSLVSLGLNSAGEYVLVSLARVQYVCARVLVAIAVSAVWNFPMHRGFVFRSVAAP
jgi:putative flippase GtrA